MIAVISCIDVHLSSVNHFFVARLGLLLIISSSLSPNQELSSPWDQQAVPPSPQSIHNIQVKTLPKPQPIQIKQEGGEVHLVDAN